MLFNSLDFVIFLPIVFILYWFVNKNNIKSQNFLIVVASYVFYGWWDYRFLALILFSTVVDYSIGLLIRGTEVQTKRKLLLWCSIIINIGLLGFFKYYNFFVDNFIQAFSFFGQSIRSNTLNIILPVGISFYTFQTLSYSIDVYRKKLEPTRDFVAFSAFVSFFPQLVAGPIERATNLLPQFKRLRTFNNKNAVDGLRQILWGLFKKLVIADNCATFVNIVFNGREHSGSSLLLGAVLFTFQIYCDFSGYSDIAIGTARLFGFNLKQNFAFPYFSRDVAEFWRRWHISLSTWFRDYVYIPLGGSRKGNWMKIRNTFIIFIVSGFWHGANWTFIVWGALNAIYFLPLLLLNKNRYYLDNVAQGKYFPKFKELIQMLLTFCLTVFAWIFFRAESISHALYFIRGIFSNSLFSMPNIRTESLILLIVFFVGIEWIGRHNAYAIEKMGASFIRPVRWAMYSFLIFLIGMFMQTNETPFIYFQF